MNLVAVPHRLHEAHVLAHCRPEKAPEPRGRPNRVQRRAEVLIQQRPHYWSGRSLTVFGSQFRQWVASQRAFAHLPIQETIDQASAMGDKVERPHQDSTLQPLSYRFTRDAVARCLLCDETLESSEDAAVHLPRSRITQGHLLDIVLRGRTRRGDHLHCCTSTGMSSA